MDQGIRSLGGYIYQMIGFISFASEMNILENSIDSETILSKLSDLDLDTQFSYKKRGKQIDIIHESMGEDILIHIPENIDIFVQVKYSFKPTENKITKGDVEEIINRFIDSRKKYKEKYGKEINILWILTNRDLTDPAENAIDERRKDYEISHKRNLID